MRNWLINMVKYEILDSYRKMRLWINEMPEESNIITSNKLLEFNANDNIHWFNGILCLELRIAPRAASNYAMLNLNSQKINVQNFKLNMILL